MKHQGAVSVSVTVAVRIVEELAGGLFSAAL
jgi:hypothetical protein